jgi:hypothetical protein
MIFISFMGTCGDYLPGAESRGKVSDDLLPIQEVGFDGEVLLLKCILVLVGKLLGIRIGFLVSVQATGMFLKRIQ